MKRNTMKRAHSLLLIVAASMLSAQDAHAQSSSQITTDCLLMVLDQVDLSARRDGVIQEMHVRLGDQISHGDAAFSLAQQEALANLNVAKARHQQAEGRAENRSAIDSAAVEVERSNREVSLLEEVGRVPYLEKFRALNTNNKNKAELDVAKMTHQENIDAARVTAAELEIAKLDLSDRQIASPLEGTVVRQFKYRGDWCNRGDPVIRILRMDKLMLQGIVNVRDVAPNRARSMLAVATFQIAGEEPIIMPDLTIARVSPEVDLDGNYLVWTYIDNLRDESESQNGDWLLRPGISGKLNLRFLND